MFKVTHLMVALALASGAAAGCEDKDDGKLDPDNTGVNERDTKVTTYILNEGMKQKDIMKWVRSAKTQERIDKLLYVMEYGLRKTESQFVSNL